MLELAMNHIVEVALGSLIGGSFYRAITIACDNTCAPNVQEINPEPEENKIEERDISDNESIHTRVIPGYDVGTRLPNPYRYNYNKGFIEPKRINF
jgi:hypothetical protein